MNDLDDENELVFFFFAPLILVPIIGYVCHYTDFLFYHHGDFPLLYVTAFMRILRVMISEYFMLMGVELAELVVLARESGKLVNSSTL